MGGCTTTDEGGERRRDARRERASQSYNTHYIVQQTKLVTTWLSSLKIKSRPSVRVLGGGRRHEHVAGKGSRLGVRRAGRALNLLVRDGTLHGTETTQRRHCDDKRGTPRDVGRAFAGSRHDGVQRHDAQQKRGGGGEKRRDEEKRRGRGREEKRREG